jgi:hypothetical protein
MQVPLTSGVVATENADFALSYPTNLEPVPSDTGIAKGYLRSAPGAATLGAGGPGADRGAILWNGILYRVMGTRLVKVLADGTATTLGDIGGTGPVSLDYSFANLIIRSGTSLYYWTGTTLTQVTDTDLGPSLDACWVDGYTVSTDGTSIVVTDLNDPTAVNPLKYGGVEADPDPVTGVMNLRSGGELVGFGANTIEFFSNVGGSLFPFEVNKSATLPIGCVGPRAKCPFLLTFAWVGGGRNQALGIWLYRNGSPSKISTRAVDDILAAVADPSTIEIEARVSRDENRLFVHLPDRTIVYLANASQATEKSLWYVARSGRQMDKAYRPRNAVLAYGQWIVGDTESAAIGTLDDGIGGHFGEAVGWQFDSIFAYNSGKGAILHRLELIGLPGRGVTVDNPQAFLSTTLDGETWSQEKARPMGPPARRDWRLTWQLDRHFRNYMGMRFRGDSSSLAGFNALEADAEALAA